MAISLPGTTDRRGSWSYTYESLDETSQMKDAEQHFYIYSVAIWFVIFNKNDIQDISVHACVRACFVGDCVRIFPLGHDD